MFTESQTEENRFKYSLFFFKITPFKVNQTHSNVKYVKNFSKGYWKSFCNDFFVVTHRSEELIILNEICCICLGNKYVPQIPFNIFSDINIIIGKYVVSFITKKKTFIKYKMFIPKNS